MDFITAVLMVLERLTTRLSLFNCFAWWMLQKLLMVLRRFLAWLSEMKRALLTHSVNNCNSANL
jgi:hypothetical protein